MSSSEAEQTFNRQLGENLKRLRKARGITQADLAEAVGYSRTSITNIEKGLQQPDALRVGAICQALKADVDDLVPKVSLPPPLRPLVRVKITTRHPEDYVLVNTADDTQWVIRDGRWAAAE